MTSRQNLQYWAFGLGTWCGVRLRVSWFLPPVVLWFVYEFGLRLGLAVFTVLVVSVLLHEIGHILAARALSGTGDEIVLWPLGGLAMVDPGSSPRARFLTAMGGPAMNLVLCGLFLPAVYAAGHLPAALNPLTLPTGPEQFGSERLLSELQLLMFSINWILLVVNLIPAYPLDGGQALRSWLGSRIGGAMAAEIAIRSAYVVAILLAVVAALFLKHVLLLVLAFLIAILALQESFQLQSSEAYDDSFMGYDFSQGYTSLERSDKAAPEARPGVLARWLESRRADRQRRAERELQQVEEQLDALLAKVHERGLEALTPNERRILKRASDRLRERGGGQE